MRKFRILALMLVLIMVLAGCGTGNSTPAAKDIVILYTNDAHCGIEDGMGYQGLSAAKRALLAAGNKVLLVDNGDPFQGRVHHRHHEQAGLRCSHPRQP